MSVLRSRQEAKVRRQNRETKGMGSGPAGEGPRGDLQVYQARLFHSTRGTRSIPILHVSFLGGPRALIGTTDTERTGEVGVPPPSPNFSPQRAP